MPSATFSKLKAYCISSAGAGSAPSDATYSPIHALRSQRGSGAKAIIWRKVRSVTASAPGSRPMASHVTASAVKAQKISANSRPRRTNWPRRAAPAVGPTASRWVVCEMALPVIALALWSYLHSTQFSPVFGATALTTPSAACARQDNTEDEGGNADSWRHRSLANGSLAKVRGAWPSTTIAAAAATAAGRAQRPAKPAATAGRAAAVRAARCSPATAASSITALQRNPKTRS